MKTNYHILIVDDVSDNIRVAMNILKEDAYDFSFAGTGQEGLELIREDPHKFNLILLDIMMPGMDGYEVCDALKQDISTQDIPIIFLTAKTDIDSVSNGFSLGAVDYITKPFHPEELLARVRNHLKLQNAQQLLRKHNIALEHKVQYTRSRLLSELEENQREMIYMLTELMEATSDETGKHIRRMSEISSLLAKYHPALSAEDEEILMHASPMHDIGKMTVPPEILHKPGRYTEAEFDEMKHHTSNAYQLLRGSQRKLLRAAAIIAHEHHERWDGEGYPRQLKSTEIHIYGRVVALADVFDALTHKRCYKEAWPPEKALDYIVENRGTQFDPELVDIFQEHFEEFKAICDAI